MFGLWETLFILSFPLPLLADKLHLLIIMSRLALLRPLYKLIPYLMMSPAHLYLLFLAVVTILSSLISISVILRMFKALLVSVTFRLHWFVSCFLLYTMINHTNRSNEGEMFDSCLRKWQGLTFSCFSGLSLLLFYVSWILFMSQSISSFSAAP